MENPEGTGMKPSVLILLLTLLFILGACKKDDGPTTVPGPNTNTTIPSVAGNWIGWAGSTNQGYALNTTIAQTQDSLLSGDCLWSSQNTDGHNTQCHFIGKVDAAGNVSIQDTGYTAVNWNGQYWHLTYLNGTLLSKKDTLTGTWTGAGNSSGPFSGGFLLVKQ